MNTEAVESDTFVNSVLVESTRVTPQETDEIRRLVLQIDDPAYRVRPGQNIGIVVNGDSSLANYEHLRRYSVTDVAPIEGEDGVAITILVKRCFYIDEINGEQYPGVASNFLCDAQPGQQVAVAGPYKNPFKVPEDTSANLLMIGTGTGIAPFRTMIQQVYRDGIEWKGDVRLYYGARNGMETLYMNEQDNDLAQYYDRETFEAFRGLPLHPLDDERDGLKESMLSHVDVAWDLINRPNTYVYLAGLKKTADVTDKVFIERAGSAQAWEDLKRQLIEEKRWSELLYG